MKILVQGDLSRLRHYKRFICKACRCVFIADNTEYEDVSTQRDGPLFQIICPCCKLWTSTNSTECVDINKFMERAMSDRKE